MMKKTFLWRKLRTGQWICLTGLALSLIALSSPEAVEAKEWKARTVAMVKDDLKNTKEATEYVIKWGDTLSVISEAVGIHQSILLV